MPWIVEALQEASENHSFPIYEVVGVLLSKFPDDARRGAETFGRSCALALQVNWRARDELSALRRIAREKAKSVAASQYGPAVGDEVLGIWERALERHGVGLAGLGRFSMFTNGWVATLRDEPEGTRRLMLGLKAIHRADSDEDALSRARDLAAQRSVPFAAIARFSELLHLARPALFPFINDEQMWVAEYMLDCSLSTRDAYFERWHAITQLGQRLALDANGLDRLLRLAGECWTNDDDAEQEREFLERVRQVRARAEL